MYTASKTSRRDNGDPALGTTNELAIQRVATDHLTPGSRSEIERLCALAYRADQTDYLRSLGPGTHYVGRVEGTLVSHGMRVTRWLQVGDGPPLRTGYVELVATHPDFERQGFASQVMRDLADDLPESYEIAALCPTTTQVYLRLGWTLWQGPLSTRMPSGAVRLTKDECVMVLDLPGRPRVDRTRPLSIEWREGEVW